MLFFIHFKGHRYLYHICVRRSTRFTRVLLWRQFEYHVHRTAVRRSHSPIVFGHLFGPWITRIHTGRRSICQIDIPVSIARDDDSLDPTSRRTVWRRRLRQHQRRYGSRAWPTKHGWKNESEIILYAKWEHTRHAHTINRSHIMSTSSHIFIRELCIFLLYCNARYHPQTYPYCSNCENFSFYICVEIRFNHLSINIWSVYTIKHMQRVRVRVNWYAK